MYYYKSSKKIRKQTIKMAFNVIISIFGVALITWLIKRSGSDDEIKENQIYTAISIYAATLPDYNDSIQKAENPEQIAYYTQKRDETNKQISEYAQRLRCGK